MASGGQFDGAIRPIMLGAAVVIVVGLAFQYWVAALVVTVILAGLIVWAIARRPPAAQSASEAQARAAIDYRYVDETESFPAALTAMRKVRNDLGANFPDFATSTKLVVESQLGSWSMLQREMRVGHDRAKEIMGYLETQQIVGPERDGRPRDVLIGRDELPMLVKLLELAAVKV